MLSIPVDFEDLLLIVDQLTETQKAALQERLAVTNFDSISSEDALKPRVAGLGEGTIWIADDFDEPLPDEFWLGKDV